MNTSHMNTCQINARQINAKFYIIPLILSISSLMIGCGASSDTDSEIVEDKLTVDLDLPDSMTGGRVSSNRNLASGIQKSALGAKSGSLPCAFIGNTDDDNPFKNGYQTTQFLVSIMATWTCIADVLIDVADIVDHDGSIVETDNDTLAANYDADDPTHYSVTDDSDTQTTIRMYYDFDRANPPTSSSVPGFYISWNESTTDNVEGRLIVDISDIDSDNPDAEAPVNMRMDFDFDQNNKKADMFLQFDDNNPWADGMRIDINKDLNANLLTQVYTARGLINMKGQFFNAPGISEIPDVQLFTVADGLGNGAAIEEIQNMSLPLELNHNQNNHLGNYLATKQDVYFFDDDMDWDYIDKTFTSAKYRGERTTLASGGSWIPFNPSLDMIITALSLDSDYFSGDLCADIDDECTELFNAVFVNGFADQEQNQGSDPMDWRTDALQAAVYLNSVYPNGENWNEAFEQSFTPSL